ncbi:PhaM family polyhydroxyalkanoate granule multifunctional regulatory protein [Paraburkholderia megapolitana]|uniref:PhaM family polyhydroxyalkanoate granule multifunctional regulatory protein n=1 Tax=Paraburkholderia megapolitana TaxID=420953 RepID=UPI0038BA59C5
MTDKSGTTPPFPGFPGFPPAGMLDRMWEMMRLTPFAGGQPGAAQGFGPSLSMMSDMMAPLTNVEELDKRITDMRAVEQWLKLNLNMLQSAIQALEVQRATLATLRAFGAFAQAPLGPKETSSSAASPFAFSAAAAAAASGSKPAEPAAKAAPAPEEAASASTAGAETGTPAFDTSGWWNLLQSQFNQLAQFAMTQPGAAPDAPAGAAAPKAAGAKQPAAKRKPAAKRASSPSRAKKTPPQPE